jgi:hypothetical protein
MSLLKTSAVNYHNKSRHYHYKTKTSNIDNHKMSVTADYEADIVIIAAKL